MKSRLTNVHVDAFRGVSSTQTIGSARSADQMRVGLGLKSSRVAEGGRGQVPCAQVCQIDMRGCAMAFAKCAEPSSVWPSENSTALAT